MLKAGIVGLPNIGKSTLFNALLKKTVAAVANYPFCTIEPNVGVIEVPDKRLPLLAEIVNTKVIIPSAIEFYDIAGLIGGASKGEGLGNKFLSHIREVDAIIHVVRLFEKADVTHVSPMIDPESDIATIDTELILSDLAILESQKKPKANASKQDKFTWVTIQKLKQELNNNIPARAISLSQEELKAIKMFNLLTLKPVIYLFNVSENQLQDQNSLSNHINSILSRATSKQAMYTSLYVCAKLESDLAELPENERFAFLQEYAIIQSGIDTLITRAYDVLSLISFLTAGVKEIRAWPVPKGTLAPVAAGTIHSDFEQHFIKAEIIPYELFVTYNGWQNAKDAGVVKLAGKNYIMHDGDVVDFKVNV